MNRLTLLMKTAVVLALCWRPAASKETVALVYDARVPQAKFAAAEICRAIEGQGNACAHQGKASAGGVRIVLAASAAESRRLASEFKLRPFTAGAPQSYALRRKTAPAATTYAALAADPNGAMYGGLDLAEAIRLGTLAELQDSEHKIGRAHV
jgi:hypothetical protein